MGCTAFPTQQAAFANNRAYSVGASYNYGPFNVAAAYMQLNNANALVPNNPNGAIASDAPFGLSRQRVFGGGLSYAFGAATVGFVFTQTMLDDATADHDGGARAAARLSA